MSTYRKVLGLLRVCSLVIIVALSEISPSSGPFTVTAWMMALSLLAIKSYEYSRGRFEEPQ
jgi:hypothetical protein